MLYFSFTLFIHKKKVQFGSANYYPRLVCHLKPSLPVQSCSSRDGVSVIHQQEGVDRGRSSASATWWYRIDIWESTMPIQCRCFGGRSNLQYPYDGQHKFCGRLFGIGVETMVSHRLSTVASFKKPRLHSLCEIKYCCIYFWS